MLHGPSELINDLRNQPNLSNNISNLLMLVDCVKATFHQGDFIDSIVVWVTRIGNKVTKNFSDIILAKFNLAKHCWKFLRLQQQLLLLLLLLLLSSLIINIYYHCHYHCLI